MARARMLEALELLTSTPRDERRALREAEAQLRLGHAYRREGQLDAARQAISESIDRHRALANDEGLAAALYELAVIDMFAARQAEAFAHFDEGLGVAERGGIRVMTGALQTARGCLLQDAGRLAEALEHHAKAARIFEELGSRYREGSALYYLGTTFLERGDVAESLALFARAAERVADVGAPRYETLIASAQASALAADARFDAAEASMQRAERSAARVENEPALVATLRLHRLGLAMRRDPGADRAAMLAEAARMVARDPSDDSRFAERLLRAIAVPRTPALPEALVVRAAGAAFALPGAATFVALPERSPLRRILEALATRRIEGGEVLTIDDVIRVGWPSEKIGAEAALNRAYVALAALRKMGLRGILLNAGGGYVLSRAVAVRIEESAP
jgi:tetratricopeptide (TPR) repeat protein